MTDINTRIEQIERSWDRIFEALDSLEFLRFDVKSPRKSRITEASKWIIIPKNGKKFSEFNKASLKVNNYKDQIKPDLLQTSSVDQFLSSVLYKLLLCVKKQ